MRWVEVKGVLLGGGCAEAKEMWEGGCQSWVAMRRVKGRFRRWFIVGAMSRPWGTARVPFWGGVVKVGGVGGVVQRGR